MSGEQEELIASRLDSIGKAVTLLKILLGSAFFIGGWVATLEYRHRSTHEVAALTASHVKSISLWKERTEASSFGAKEGTAMFNLLSARHNAEELRIQKAELRQEEIFKSLARIESKLGTK